MCKGVNDVDSVFDEGCGFEWLCQLSNFSVLSLQRSNLEERVFLV